MPYIPREGDTIMLPATVIKTDDKNNILVQICDQRIGLNFTDLQNFGQKIAAPGTTQVTAPANAYPDYGSMVGAGAAHQRASWEAWMKSHNVAGWTS